MIPVKLVTCRKTISIKSLLRCNSTVLDNLSVLGFITEGQMGQIIQKWTK